MKLLVQFPTLARQFKFLQCLSKYVNMASGLHEITFNINCDIDDPTMNNDETNKEITDIFLHQSNRPHRSKREVNFDKNTNKISAINDHIEPDLYDIIICASDDMIPQVEGWDDEIAKAMQENYPDLDGCVHFNDGYTDGKLITFSILGRELYKEFGYIYHPDYMSLYCDNEFTQEVTRMGKVTYVDNVVIKHEHYGEKGNSNSGEEDFAARKTLYFSGRDGQVFEHRKHLGFPKEKITTDYQT